MLKFRIDMFIIVAIQCRVNYTPAKENAIPTTAEKAIKMTGCRFFVGFTARVRTSKTAASTKALKFKRFAIFSVSAYKSRFKNVISHTKTPAAAINAVDAGRSP